MDGCGSLINLGLHETTVRFRNGFFNVPWPRGCSRNEASFGSSFLPTSRHHPSPLRGEGRVRGRAERNVNSCRGVGWGEPQANPNTRTFTRLATLGSRGVTPRSARTLIRLPAPSPGGRRIRPEKLRQNAPLKRAPVLEHPLGNGTLKHPLRKRTVVSCRPRLIRLPQPSTAPSSRVASL